MVTCPVLIVQPPDACMLTVKFELALGLTVKLVL